MDVAGERQMDRIDAAHLVDEGASWGLPRRRARRVVEQTLEALRTALEEVDRDAHSGVGPQAWQAVTERADVLRASLADA
jgi:serine/threonine-protein kinase HipA